MTKSSRNIFEMYRGLPKEIYFLFAGKIINSLGFFVFPFLSIFLTANMGLSEGRVGIIMMIASSAFIPGSLIGGKLSDKYGRKKVLVFSQSLAAIMLVPCAFLGDSLLIPDLLVISSLFNGAAHPTYNAMCADLTRPDNRKEAYSLLYLGNNLGVAVGPLFAGFLYNNHVEWIFLGDALTSIVSVLLIAAFVRETKPDDSAIDEGIKLDSDERTERGSVMKVLLRRPFMLVFSLFFTLQSFVYSQMEFALPLQTKATFGIEDGPVVFGSLMTVNALTVIFATVFIINLTRRNKALMNICLAGIFLGVGFGMIYFVKGHVFLVFSTFIWTLGEILSATNLNVYIANHAPMSHRGRFSSVVMMISGAGHSFGPAFVGWFILKRSLKAVWPLTFWVSILSSVLMFGLYLAEERRTKNSAKQTA